MIVRGLRSVTHLPCPSAASRWTNWVAVFLPSSTCHSSIGGTGGDGGDGGEFSIYSIIIVYGDVIIVVQGND